MQIVELGDCSMVIMKDSEDPPWVSVGDIYRESENGDFPISVFKIKETELENHKIWKTWEVSQQASDAICTSGRLILFFSNPVDSNFHLHDRVTLATSAVRRRR